MPDFWVRNDVYCYIRKVPSSVFPLLSVVCVSVCVSVSVSVFLLRVKIDYVSSNVFFPVIGFALCQDMCHIYIILDHF